MGMSGWLGQWDARQLAKEAAGQWRGITLLLCLMALLLGVQNPLLYGMTPAFDASLFATMGKMWAEGDVLYRDMMDIKGPMIFLFDAIGYKAGGFPGIAVLEILLLALGLTHETAHGSVRLTLSHETTEEDIDYVLEKFPPIVARLREMSPFYNKK